MDQGEFDALGTLLAKLAEECHRRSRGNGFWESHPEAALDPDDKLAMYEVATKIGLIGDEQSELLEAWRLADPFGPCPKDERLTHMDEEAADVAIRLLDLCAMLGIDLGRAIKIKMAHNATRPYTLSKRF
jgi:NTP pyrophosphatase (non-canonical NTP hydrolase)